MAKKSKSAPVIKGTQNSDFVSIDADDLKLSKVYLGDGFDTLAITSTEDYTFTGKSYKKLVGVDALDFSGILGENLVVKIPRSLLKRSDDKELTIVSGDNGIDSLQAVAGNKGTVIVDGSGLVQLADGRSNKVTIADNSTVEVVGGTGRDTITAASDGSMLNGGRGNDTLVLGEGADTVMVGADMGRDKVVGFDAAEDTIEFSDSDFVTFDDILAASRQTKGGDTIVDLGGGNRVTLKGVELDALEEANFSLDGQQLAPQTYVIDSDTSAADLNAMIAAAADGSTFILTDGTHTFSESIVIDRSNITLKGESEADTIIQFDFAAGSEADGLMVTGGTKSYLGVADNGVTAGDNFITLAGNNLAAGDSIYMFQANTREWLDANGWQNVSMEDADNRPFREAIMQVDYVDGDTVYFTHEIPYSMDQGKVKLNNIDLLDNVALGDFTVTYNLGTTDAYDFSNTLPDYLGNIALSVIGTSNASLERISVVDFASKGLVIGSSIDLVADDILASGSHNKGGDGNGYGILLYESNNNSLTNLEIFDTRHSAITSAWSAETDNYIHVADTNRDISFHGSPDKGNVVEVDNMVLDFDTPFDGNGGTSWSTVSGSGSNHAMIDPFAENTITFGNVEGSNRSDVMMANDSGVYMNGKYGFDTLVGGAGDDYLVGGTLKDTLTGGGGSDTFLLRVGDNLDRITDMEFGVDGDTIVFANNTGVTSFDDLRIYTQNGETRIRYGSNATVILEGVDVADIDATNFEYDPDGSLTAELYYGSDFGIV